MLGCTATGQPQLVWTRLVDDLETPVSAYLKIANGERYAFLFESVEGGAWRGRYSVVAMRPDLVWRCRGDRAEISEGDAIAADRFVAQSGGALDSLRDLVSRSRMDSARGAAAHVRLGRLRGHQGYDMVRLAERLPLTNPDPLDLPDAIMIRPSVVAIFDAIGQEIVLATTVQGCVGRHGRGRSMHRPARACRRWPMTCAVPCPRRRNGPSASRAPSNLPSPARPMVTWSSGPNAISRPATSSRWCPATVSARRSGPIRSPSIARSGG